MAMIRTENSAAVSETAPSAAVKGTPPPPSGAPPLAKPQLAGSAAGAAATPRIENKPVAQAPIVAPKPPDSWPISMVVHPVGNLVGNLAPSSDRPPQRFPGELPESFATALARVEALPADTGWFGAWSRRFSREAARTTRVVAFDGFRSDLYDEKLERDRRYGTVYTVVEHKNAYLVRLEMPRRLASSALRATWNMPGEMPDYDYTITLTSNGLTVKASVPGEALRRLSYISTSFPADFMTRIEFSQPVDSFCHRLRDKVLEIIVFKRTAARDANQTVALQS
jgi:hypothetical protein